MRPNDVAIGPTKLGEHIENGLDEVFARGEFAERLFREPRSCRVDRNGLPPVTSCVSRPKRLALELKRGSVWAFG